MVDRALQVGACDISHAIIADEWSRIYIVQPRFWPRFNCCVCQIIDIIYGHYSCVLR